MTQPTSHAAHAAAATSHAAEAQRIVAGLHDLRDLPAHLAEDPIFRSLLAVAHGLLAHYHAAAPGLARLLGDAAPVVDAVDPAAAPVVDAAAALAQEAAGVQAH